jgi:hypothetical protein
MIAGLRSVGYRLQGFWGKAEIGKAESRNPNQKAEKGSGEVARSPRCAGWRGEFRAAPQRQPYRRWEPKAGVLAGLRLLRLLLFIFCVFRVFRG